MSVCVKTTGEKILEKTQPTSGLVIKNWRQEKKNMDSNVNVKYVSRKSSRDDYVKTLKLEIETLKKRIRTLETNRNVEKAWRKKNNRANFVYGSKHLDQLDLKIMEKRKSLPEVISTELLEEFPICNKYFPSSTLH